MGKESEKSVADKSNHSDKKDMPSLSFNQDFVRMCQAFKKKQIMNQDFVANRLNDGMRRGIYS